MLAGFKQGVGDQAPEVSETPSDCDYYHSDDA